MGRHHGRNNRKHPRDKRKLDQMELYGSIRKPMPRPSSVHEDEEDDFDHRKYIGEVPDDFDEYED